MEHLTKSLFGWNLKRWLWTLLACVVFVVGTYATYAWRAPILAAIWHWRHGHSAYLDGYEIPVPDHWMPMDFAGADSLSLVNTRVRRTGDPLADINVIGVIVLPRAPNLDAWVAQTRKWHQSQGLKEIEEKTIQAGDETIVCLGGQVFRDQYHVSETAAITSSCQSNGRLVLIFNGSRTGLQEFYAIASGIRKPDVPPRADLSPK